MHRSIRFPVLSLLLSFLIPCGPLFSEVGPQSDWRQIAGDNLPQLEKALRAASPSAKPR